MSTRTPIGHDLLEQLASLEAVDGPAKPLAKAVRGIKAPAKVNETLSGTWLGHPVHPLLIVVPMGSWISAVLLDWLGGEDAESAADLLVGAGLAGAVPTVATGYADWADTEPASDTVRRIGLVHAAFNATAAGAVRRLAGRPRRRLRAAAASCSRWPAWASSPSAATSAATSPTPRASASTSTTFEEYPQDWTQALPTPRWARARCARSTSTASRS